MSDGISISPEEAAVRLAIRELVNPIHPFGGKTNQRQKHMNESRKQQLAGKASSNPQNPTTPKTRKKRWHFKSLLVVMSLSVLVVGIYLLRSVLFPNYLGVGVALCFVASGLFLVRGAIRMFLEFDKLQAPGLKENESTTSPSEANVVGKETDCSARPPEN
jgi:hypothetical protein